MTLDTRVIIADLSGKYIEVITRVSLICTPLPNVKYPGAVTCRGDGTPGAAHGSDSHHVACLRFCRWRAGEDRHDRAHDRCRKMLMPGFA